MPHIIDVTTPNAHNCISKEFKLDETPLRPRAAFKTALCNAGKEASPAAASNSDANALINKGQSVATHRSKISHSSRDARRPDLGNAREEARSTGNDAR
mmetsp:Transcript_159093/g.296406  ORF Transcript_159093/g.296406 Transcript_159093/m.296406 type:complete len:99 (+) Transcript_159093:1808-2104(+)